MESRLVLVTGVTGYIGGRLVPQLIEALKKEGGEDIIVIVGGVVPPGDYDLLRQMGVQAIFGPGTSIVNSANQVLNLLGA